MPGRADRWDRYKGSADGVATARSADYFTNLISNAGWSIQHTYITLSFSPPTGT